MTDEIEKTTEEYKKEEQFNIVGFNLTRDALEGIEPPTISEPEKNQTLGRVVMDAALARYFDANEGDYLDPSNRKYIFAGASMAYVFWANQLMPEMSGGIDE